MKKFSQIDIILTFGFPWDGISAMKAPSDIDPFTIQISVAQKTK